MSSATTTVRRKTQHFAVTLHLIEQGIPLLVEKPLVFDLDEGRQLVDAPTARGLFLAINLKHRHAEPVLHARAAIEGGMLGRISFAAWRFAARAAPTATYSDDRGRDFHATFGRYPDALVPRAQGREPPITAVAGMRALELARASVVSFERGVRVESPVG